MTGSDGQAFSGLESLRAGDRVAVALSGGLDSAVAARRLLELGLDVLAFHLVLSPEDTGLDPARAAARTLGLDLKVLDLREEFEKLIIEPFIRTYARGETPSPCIACNSVIKFGLLRERAEGLGARRLATGHYAALARRPGSAGPVLLRPADRAKDQTYFLCRLSPDMLARAAFPLAGLTKAQVRSRAEDLGLGRRPESQEVCFLAGRDYREFIKARLGRDAAEPGEFVDIEGRVLGRHRGLSGYTVGQRRGLGLPGPAPYYVLALEPDRNRIVIGTKEQTLTRRCLARDVIWSARPPETAFNALVQVRSRHRPAPARVSLLNGDRIEVVFERPQSSVAAGQAAAVYAGQTLLGGGWIERRV